MWSRERLRADTNVLDVVQGAVGHELPQVLLPRLRLHDARIATGEEDVGHERLGAQVVVQLLCLSVVEGVKTNELCPAEAVRAVRVTVLALRRKEQHGLLVLVLHAVNTPSVRANWPVELDLPGRMRIHLQPDAVDQVPPRDLLLAALERVDDEVDAVGVQHALLWKSQLENGIVRDVGPVDEL